MYSDLLIVVSVSSLVLNVMYNSNAYLMQNLNPSKCLNAYLKNLRILLYSSTFIRTIRFPSSIIGSNYLKLLASRRTGRTQSYSGRRRREASRKSSIELLWQRRRLEWCLLWRECSRLSTDHPICLYIPRPIHLEDQAKK